jgi:uncharacterized protein YoaH (UPF0181 family)
MASATSSGDFFSSSSSGSALSLKAQRIQEQLRGTESYLSNFEATR